MSINNSAVETVIARATVDQDFRRSLLESPAAAIKEATGIQLPAGITVKFVEKDKSTDALYVLPDYVNAEAELNAEELEAVAGGMAQAEAWCDNICITTTTQVTMAESES